MRDGALTDCTISSQSRLGNNGNEEILHSPGASPSDAIYYYTQDTPF